jgi:hypothetical protein
MNRWAALAAAGVALLAAIFYLVQALGGGTMLAWVAFALAFVGALLFAITAVQEFRKHHRSARRPLP